MTATKVTSGRFKVSSLLATQLGEGQVQLATVLRCAGLPAGFFQPEKSCVTTDEPFAPWRAIGESSANPAIGLKLGAEPHCERYQPSADVGEQVKHTLKRSLAGKRPTLQHAARELCRSARTLQRRLTDAEITFQQLVEDTRRERVLDPP